MTHNTVRASKLYKRTLFVRAREIAEASVIPFFDNQGRIEWLMIVHPVTSDIFFVRRRPGRNVVTEDGVIRLRTPPKRWEDLSASAQYEICNLVHYDPWWVLSHRRFKRHEAVPYLKRTNRLDAFEGCDVRYATDLSVVQSAGLPRLTDPDALRDTATWRINAWWLKVA